MSDQVKRWEKICLVCQSCHSLGDGDPCTCLECEAKKGMLAAAKWHEKAYSTGGSFWLDERIRGILNSILTGKGPDDE